MPRVRTYAAPHWNFGITVTLGSPRRAAAHSSEVHEIAIKPQTAVGGLPRASLLWLDAPGNSTGKSIRNIDLNFEV